MPRKNCKAAGTAREHKVMRHLEQRGWLTMRAPASLGAADIIALNYQAERPLMIQVKANRDGGPWMNFRPKERQELSAAAARAGAAAHLVWWPPHGEMQWIPEDEWP